MAVNLTTVHSGTGSDLWTEISKQRHRQNQWFFKIFLSWGPGKWITQTIQSYGEMALKPCYSSLKALCWHYLEDTDVVSARGIKHQRHNRSSQTDWTLNGVIININDRFAVDLCFLWLCALFSSCGLLLSFLCVQEGATGLHAKVL